MPGLTGPDLTASFAGPDEPCPTSTLNAYLKQLNRAQLNDAEVGVLNVAFNGFLANHTKPESLSATWLEQAGFPVDGWDRDRVPRRYDGDLTLPPGRYSTICADLNGDDGGTLAREMTFYSSPTALGGQVRVYDTCRPEDAKSVAAMGLGPEGPPRLVLQYFDFFQRPGEPHGMVQTGIEISTSEVHIENVLDLRRPAAANWLTRTISALTFSDPGGEHIRCFPYRADLTDFPEVLPSLMDQATGGGNFCKLVGLYLRELGVAGLVFPSARSDVSVTFQDGLVTDSYGWSFVDFRDAPKPRIRVFWEERPDWPQSLVVEAGDGYVPFPALFANEVSFLTEGYDLGTGQTKVQGLEQRLKTVYVIANVQAAIEYRLPRVGKSDASDLTTVIVSLGARQGASLGWMVLLSLLEIKLGRDDLQAFVRDGLAQLLPDMPRNRGLRSLLRACCDPPKLSRKDLSRETLLRRIVSGSHETRKPVPEPAT